MAKTVGLGFTRSINSSLCYIGELPKDLRANLIVGRVLWKPGRCSVRHPYDPFSPTCREVTVLAKVSVRTLNFVVSAQSVDTMRPIVTTSTSSGIAAKNRPSRWAATQPLRCGHLFPTQDHGTRSTDMLPTATTSMMSEGKVKGQGDPTVSGRASLGLLRHRHAGYRHGSSTFGKCLLGSLSEMNVARHRAELAMAHCLHDLSRSCAAHRKMRCNAMT